MKLRLGTRESRLAMAQSHLIVAALKRHHPELTVELVTVKERGDTDLSTPLRRVKDPNFFNARLGRGPGGQPRGPLRACL